MSNRKQWRCFHCDRVFRSEEQARIHFGIDQFKTPGCLLSNADGHLLEYVRKLEAEIEEYRRESHDLLLAAHSAYMDARQIEPIAEQRGYDKGVSDTWDMARKGAAA
jgi:hypothetical protein